MLVLREREIIQIETQQLQNLEKQYRVQIGEEDPNKKADAADATKAAADNHPELTGGSSENLNKTKGDTSFKDEKNLAKPKPGGKPGGKPSSKPSTRPSSKPAASNRPTTSTSTKPQTGTKPGTQSSAKPSKPSAQPAK